MKLELTQSAVLGAVTGDALGVPVEFRARQALASDPVTGMRAYGTHRQPAGTWSDDSSMLLCLLESLTHGLDYDDMMHRFFRWADEGYRTPYGEVFDIGGATQNALARYGRGTPALECGGAGKRDNGNGSLMRILPMALYLHKTMGADFPSQAAAYPLIDNASALTHAHPVSKIACGIYCAAANELLCGRTRPEDIQNGIAAAKAYYQSAQGLAPFLEDFKRVDVAVLQALPQEQIRSTGYVLYTLEASLWCLLHTEDYRSCVLAAVNLGDDTDTTGAVAGGLAGLRYREIPGEWLDVLAKRTEIEALCTAFAESVGV